MDVWSPSLEIGRSNDYLEREYTTSDGSGNGWLLARNGEDEEIVCARPEKVWQLSVNEVAFTE